MITLLNFENAFRPQKVAKSKEMFLRGQVVELRKAAIMWIGKMKIGAYKVQVDIDGIHVQRNSCNCDSRPRSGFCEHSLAVLFALRKELNLYPALTTATPKLVPSTNVLAAQLEVLNKPETKVFKKDETIFTSAAKNILKTAAANIQKGNYRPAMADCMDTIRQVFDMCLIRQHNYNKSDSLFGEAFDLLQDAISKTTDEELLEHVAHDMRVEALRNFRADDYLFQQWMELLRPISNQGNRLEKFHKVTETLDRINSMYSSQRRY